MDYPVPEIPGNSEAINNSPCLFIFDVVSSFVSSFCLSSYSGKRDGRVQTSLWQSEGNCMILKQSSIFVQNENDTFVLSIPLISRLSAKTGISPSRLLSWTIFLSFSPFLFPSFVNNSANSTKTLWTVSGLSCISDSLIEMKIFELFQNMLWETEEPVTSFEMDKKLP